jgi:hypothetical protein
MEVSISFVRSHQELKNLKSELSPMENLIIILDSLAKEAQQYHRVTQYSSLPQNPVDLKINNIAINSKYALKSEKAFHSIAFRKYLQDKYHWSNSTIESVWWKPYHNSIMNLNSVERTIIFKLSHDRLPTIVREKKYYSYRTKHCNHRQGEHEDEDHILRCLSVNRSKSRQVWFNNISNYLSEAHTPPPVKNSILFHFTIGSNP